jgi:hypothetical protein
MRRVLSLLPLSIFFVVYILSGCSHTYPITFATDKVSGDTVTVETFNRRLANTEVSIITRNGREISVSKVFLTPDSCRFADSTGRAFLPTADVFVVRHVDHVSSTVGGLGLGFLGGFAVGMGGGLLMIKPGDADSRMGAGLFAIGTTVVGSIVGMIVGGLHGTIRDYTMPEAVPDSTVHQRERRSALDSDQTAPGSGANDN